MLLLPPSQLSLDLADDGLLRNIEELQSYHSSCSDVDLAGDSTLRQLRVRRQLLEAEQVLQQAQPLEDAVEAVVELADTAVKQAEAADERLRLTESRLSKLLQYSSTFEKLSIAAEKKRYCSSLLCAAFVVGPQERQAAKEGPGHSHQDSHLSALIAGLIAPMAYHYDLARGPSAEETRPAGEQLAPAAPPADSTAPHDGHEPALSLACDCFSTLEHVRWARARSVALLGTPLHALGMDALKHTAEAQEGALQGMGRWAVAAAGRLWARSDPPEVRLPVMLGPELYVKEGRGRGGGGAGLGEGEGDGDAFAWRGPSSIGRGLGVIGGGSGGGSRPRARDQVMRLPGALEAVMGKMKLGAAGLRGMGGPAGGASSGDSGMGGGGGNGEELVSALEALESWDYGGGSESSAAAATAGSVDDGSVLAGRSGWLGERVMRARLGMAARARARQGAGAGGLLRLALEWLVMRPALLRRAVQAVLGARRRVVARDLVRALSRGDPDRGVAPLDARLHDSAGYVGDVLGWVHSRLVEEREAVLAPLGLLATGAGTGGGAAGVGTVARTSTILASRGGFDGGQSRGAKVGSAHEAEDIKPEGPGEQHDAAESKEGESEAADARAKARGDEQRGKEQGEERVPLPCEVAPASLDDLASAIEQPVRVRLYQAVEAAGDGLAAYRILDTLALYRGMLSLGQYGQRSAGGAAGTGPIDGGPRPLLSASSSFLTQLSALEAAAYERLYLAVKEGGDVALGSSGGGLGTSGASASAVPAVPPDLGPHPACEDAVERLAPFLRLLGSGANGSRGGADPVEDAMGGESGRRLAPVLSAVLRPAVEAVRAAAESYPKGQGAVHTVNSIEVLLQRLRRHGATSAWVQRLAAYQGEAEEAVVEAEAASVLEGAGFASAERAVRGLRAGDSAGLTQSEEILQRVTSALWRACSRFELSKQVGGRLRAPRVRQRVRRRVGQVLRAAFGKLRGLVDDAASGLAAGAAQEVSGGYAAAGAEAVRRPFASVTLPADSDVQAILGLD